MGPWIIFIFLFMLTYIYVPQVFYNEHALMVWANVYLSDSERLFLGSSVPFRARMDTRAHGSQDGHVGACLGLCANKWPFSDIYDTFYTNPTGGKNPIQLLVPFPRILITDRLCASLQAVIKHREDWALDLKLFTKFNSKTKKHTRDRFWGQDKKRLAAA